MQRNPKSSVRPLATRANSTEAPQPDAAAPNDAQARLPERRKGGERRVDQAPVPPVLVITGDPSLSRMMTFALSQMRLEFREMTSGTASLNELIQMRVGTRPPVVILDVDLPGMDGHAVLERVGTDRPDTFLILVLSSHADEAIQVRSLLAGAVDHIAKPFNVRVLMAKVHRWVAMSARLTAPR